MNERISDWILIVSAYDLAFDLDISRTGDFATPGSPVFCRGARSVAFSLLTPSLTKEQPHVRQMSVLISLSFLVPHRCLFALAREEA
jgi:hypothetical protein